MPSGPQVHLAPVREAAGPQVHLAPVREAVGIGDPIPEAAVGIAGIPTREAAAGIVGIQVIQAGIPIGEKRDGKTV